MVVIACMTVTGRIIIVIGLPLQTCQSTETFLAIQKPLLGVGGHMYLHMTGASCEDFFQRAKLE